MTAAGPAGSPAGPPVGPLAEEVRRLAEAARDWAVRTFPEPDAHSASFATGSPECCWCPLCRAVAVLRGDHPEVTDRVVEVVTAAAGALAAVLDATTRPGAPTADPDPDPDRADPGAGPVDSPVGAAPAARGVESIPLDGD